MKPNFALTLTHEGVALLQRSPRGWLSVGEVALNDPAFDEAVAGLRAVAQSLAPDGVFTKVVIPDSELLYAVVAVPGPDPEARHAAIREALEGATPYPVDDLVYDWSGRGTHLNVAVVARETLEEAEGFAAAHGFNPVSFVARPGADRYIGEPFFGLTATAASVLPPGERVERDFVPVTVVGRAERPTAAARPIFGKTSVASAAAATDRDPSAAEPATPPAEVLAAPATLLPAEDPPAQTALDLTEPDSGNPDPLAPESPDAPLPIAPVADMPAAADATAGGNVASEPASRDAAADGTAATDLSNAAAGSGRTEGGHVPDGPTEAHTPDDQAPEPQSARADPAPEHAPDPGPDPALDPAPAPGPAATGAAPMQTEPARPEPAASAADEAPFVEAVADDETSFRDGAGHDASDGAGDGTGEEPESDPESDPVPVVFASRRRPQLDSQASPAPEGAAEAPARAAGGGSVTPLPVPGAARAAGSEVRSPTGAEAAVVEAVDAKAEPAAPPAAGRAAQAGAVLAGVPASLEGLRRRIGAAGAGLTAAIAKMRPQPGGEGGPAPFGGLGSKASGTGSRGAERPAPPAPALLRAAPGGRAAAGAEPAAIAPVRGAPRALSGRPPAPSRTRSRSAAAPGLSRIPAGGTAGGPVQLLASRSTQPLAIDGSASEAEAMTVFGARGQPPSRFPELRVGLLLSVALVVLLGGVGLWAALFLPGRDDPAQEVAALPQAAPPAGEESVAIAPPDLLSDGILPEEAAALLDGAGDAGFAPFNVDEPIEDAVAAEAAEAAGALSEPSAPLPFAGETGLAGLPDASATTPPAPLAPEAEAADTAAADPAPDLAGEELTPEEMAAAAVEAALAEDLLGLDAAPEAQPEDVPAAAALAEMTPEELAAAWEETGVWPVAPDPPGAPRAASLSDLRPVAADDTIAGAPRQSLPDIPETVAPPAAAAAPPPFDPALLALAPAPGAAAPAAPEAGQGQPATLAPPAAAAPAGALPADERDLVITVTAGSPPMVPGLRREIVSRHRLIEGDLPVPETAEPLPRPPGLGGDSAIGANPDLLPETAPAAGPGAVAVAAAPVAPADPAPPAEAARADATAEAATLSIAAMPARTPAPPAAAAEAETQPDAETLAALPPETAAEPPAETDRAAAAPAATGAPAPVGRIPAIDASAAGIALRPAARPESLPTPPGPTVIAIATPTGETLRAPIRPPEVVEAAAPIMAASPLAVAASLVPGGRPSDFSILVARAAPPPTPQAAAPAAQPQPQQAAPQPQPQQAAPAPQQAAAVATPAPQLPTRASVAQQATQTRAMNLRQINLIGVFGTASDRRALVRLSNGRIVSVRVGDQLDGGQVAAIGDSELRYVRRGQNNVLRVGG